MFDFAHFVSMIPDIVKAFKETLIMIGISSAAALIVWLAARGFNICNG